MALSSAPSTPAWSAPPLPDSVRAVAAPDPAVGLTADEVADRRARGLSNVTSGEGIRRSFGDIVRANVCTRFNAILGTLLLVVLATGELRDALFGAVLVANTLIGIIQELRAKRTLDRLAVVVAPNVRVVRAGQLAAIPPCEVVADEVIDLGAGDQVPVDGVALTATNLEVDESLLTGESDPVAKPVGARLLSGSLVIAGRGRITATAVGDAAYAARLAREARRFTTVHSELRAATDTILKVGTWIIAPAALLLLASQLGTDQRLSEALRATVAGVAAIVPEGLVLLTSVAFAVGVIRLARRRALLQELPAVEVLARVDVVCLDKTGT